MRSLFLTDRFFWLFGSIAVAFALSYAFEGLFRWAQLAFVLALALTGVDALVLYGRHQYLTCRRQMASVFSLGDPNPVAIEVENRSNFRLKIAAVDELPVQLQARDFSLSAVIPPGEGLKLCYQVRPLTRGAYAFGDIHLFASSAVGLLERRFTFESSCEVAVYPSVFQMRRYELTALRGTAADKGIKRVRRLGHGYEFEQIKNYVEGDDYRSINWKASGRRGTLMVNQYEDERSQQLFCILDKSRTMNMPFGGMSLLDYAINTALIISNIALKKQDRVGLLSFSDVLGSAIPAERGIRQLRVLLKALYREQERSSEANYELLYQAVRRLIPRRALLLLFTNFESRYALERALPVLRNLNRMHLLVVTFFENAEVRTIAETLPTDMLGLFRQSVARQFLEEKEEIKNSLAQHGIQVVLTKPEALSVNTINKYLELKARGLI
ncbi:MAG: DUF58 domain-containing protein [Saprospiraceae bacterium]|nr:DUF58 domain-containing protein [Saprospiraceae bacterium]MDW8484082.1 DUF58 domain-containing protein [Saprospiraceae bacterium]